MPYIGKKTAIKLRKSITFKTIKSCVKFSFREEKSRFGDRFLSLFNKYLKHPVNANSILVFYRCFEHFATYRTLQKVNNAQLKIFLKNLAHAAHTVQMSYCMAYK